VNSLERVIAALNRKELPDRVPYMEWGIDHTIIEALQPGKSYCDFVEDSIIDGVTANAQLEEKREYIDADTYVDEWRIKRRRSPEDIWYPIEAPLKDAGIEDLNYFITPDPTASHRFTALRKLVERFKGKKAIIFFVNDAYSIPSRLRGVEQWLMDFVENPDIIRKLVDICVEYNCKLAECALKEGADIIASGDDYAFNTGPFINPVYFEEFIAPGLARLVETVHTNGGYFIKHTDGNIYKIIESIINTGIDGLNPIEPGNAGMDLGLVKKKYGSRVCLMGNVECSTLLAFGSREEVVAEVKKCIDIAAPGGGYIISSSNSIHSSVKPENFTAMMEAIELYGKY
jgi:uroporphyrinogen decarboxylase